MRVQSFPVGVGVLIINDGGQVLLAPRSGAVGEVGQYGAVGGGMHVGESFEGALRRELAEECGSQVQIKDLRWLCTLNFRSASGQHWVGLGAVAQWAGGDPRWMEPDKMGEWSWYDMDRLPEPLYPPTAWTLEAYRTGRAWFDEAKGL